jgi:cytochrome c oxidase subunit 3
MATLNPPISVRDPATRHGAGGTHPPVSGGDSGGRGGDNSSDYGARLRRARLGLAVASVSISMLFVAFTSAYIFRQGLPTFDGSTNTYVRDWLTASLPLTMLLVNTLLLVLSSLTMELARRQITRQTALAPVESIPGVSLGQERYFPWLGASVVLGVGFLVGQWMAWQELAARGFYLATNPSSSFFYLLTAAHAVHLTGGLIAMIYAGAISLLHEPVEAQRMVVDITAWYWHFMALLWIYVFALLWFAR